jgi:putative oxidoreductase
MPFDTMYAGHTTIEIAGQLMLAFTFLGTALVNSTTQVKQHADRMAAYGIPLPYVCLWTGFAIQYAGSILVALDIWTDIGVGLLILFTVLATAIFHRFWLVDDPLRRHIHKSIIFSNIGLIGGLLWLL